MAMAAAAAGQKLPGQSFLCISGHSLPPHMLVTTTVSEPRDLGCSKGLLSLAENLLCSPPHHSFGYCESDKGQKDTFPIRRVNAGQAD